MVLDFLFTVSLLVCALIGVVEAIKLRRKKRFYFEAMVLLAVAALYFGLISPPADERVAFGPGDAIGPLVTLAVLFSSILIGITAQFFFYQETVFTPKSFLKPFFASPLILLPLVGTINPESNLSLFQLVSLSLIAFQNGFFWRLVFEHAKPTT